jgi:hypothetical protein
MGCRTIGEGPRKKDRGRICCEEDGENMNLGRKIRVRKWRRK